VHGNKVVLQMSEKLMLMQDLLTLNSRANTAKFLHVGSNTEHESNVHTHCSDVSA
jgi:hypothetical protein